MERAVKFTAVKRIGMSIFYEWKMPDGTRWQRSTQLTPKRPEQGSLYEGELRAGMVVIVQYEQELYVGPTRPIKTLRVRLLREIPRPGLWLGETFFNEAQGFDVEHTLEPPVPVAAIARKHIVAVEGGAPPQ